MFIPLYHLLDANETESFNMTSVAASIYIVETLIIEQEPLRLYVLN